MVVTWGAVVMVGRARQGQAEVGKAADSMVAAAVTALEGLDMVAVGATVQGWAAAIRAVEAAAVTATAAAVTVLAVVAMVVAAAAVWGWAAATGVMEGGWV
eukprot:5444749-Prymnesium_polylepis.2